jgi:hypothetical protein
MPYNHPSPTTHYKRNVSSHEFEVISIPAGLPTQIVYIPEY